MRLLIVLVSLLTLVLSGLHAGPVAAHGSEHSPTAVAGVHHHGHVDDGDGPADGDSSADMKSEPGHQHSPSGPAPQFPQADLVLQFDKQAVFASEASLLRLGAPAPPLDPPIA